MSTSDYLRARGHFIISWRKIVEKEFRTIEQQIQILKSKNLQCEEKRAAYILENNNYYYLINGYKHLFLNSISKKEKFVDGTSLEEIFSLYEFDRKIRILFLEYILLIERKIKAYISYEFSKEHGYKDYLVENNFYNNKKHQKKIEKLINDINEDVLHQYKNSNKMIVHYLDTYNYIPFWVLIRILSFGKVSKFYSLMKPREQNIIGRKFNLKSEKLKVYLTNLGEIRNLCAHDEKLFDIRLRFKISNNLYHFKLNIPKIKGNYTKGLQDLFSIVLILKEMLSQNEFINFYKMLIKRIYELKQNIFSINFNKILNTMGFPANYKRILHM